jgi:hypothetical protein
MLFDDAGRVTVGVIGMTTGLTMKRRLIRAIRFVSVAAYGTLPAGVVRGNLEQRLVCPVHLVAQKRFQLVQADAQQSLIQTAFG